MCTNTIGSYSCSCQTSGYTLDGNKHNCSGMYQFNYILKLEIILDINECTMNNGGCAQLCTNTPGSYQCNCNNGYTLNLDRHNCSGMKHGNFIICY